MGEWLSDNAWSVWLAVAAVLGVAELMSLDLVLVMLAVGALAGMVTAVLGAPVVLQLLVAGGAAAAMLTLVRPSVVKRLHTGPDLRLGHGKLVGQQAVVTERMTGHETGRIRIGGEIWSATPYDDTLSIEAGETVEVLQIRGATALVHPVPSLEG
ncbi:NfeD family protein [Nocardioides sp.]|uniref:NfeD family protein n=1 Tax=Nocardioides sp. TaxID=35761 RepID=UPI002724C8FB|nr:NfeD family protein [Nocardioides sp.]MDO9457009.1 NfeD family protein [Nocardioides sp.]